MIASRSIFSIALVAMTGWVVSSCSQEVTDPVARGNLPNPISTVIKNWAPLPGGREWGSTAGIDIGPDGHIWAYDRCGAVDLRDPGCETRNIDAIFKISRNTGEIMTAFGAGEFVVPHGIHVDSDGNVYVAEGPNSREVAGGGLSKYLP